MLKNVLYVDNHFQKYISPKSKRIKLDNKYFKFIKNNRNEIRGIFYHDSNSFRTEKFGSNQPQITYHVSVSNPLQTLLQPFFRSQNELNSAVQLIRDSFEHGYFEGSRNIKI